MTDFGCFIMVVVFRAGWDTSLIFVHGFVKRYEIGDDKTSGHSSYP